jgi:hypothetical protein
VQLSKEYKYTHNIYSPHVMLVLQLSRLYLHAAGGFGTFFWCYPPLPKLSRGALQNVHELACWILVIQSTVDLLLLNIVFSLLLTNMTGFLVALAVRITTPQYHSPFSQRGVVTKDATTVKDIPYRIV